jgi:hypothetical protein
MDSQAGGDGRPGRASRGALFEGCPIWFSAGDRKELAEHLQTGRRSPRNTCTYYLNVQSKSILMYLEIVFVIIKSNA